MSEYPPLDSLDSQDETPTLEEARTAFQERLNTIESESYRKNTKLAVEDALEFFEQRDDIQDLEDIDGHACRRWVQTLAARTRDGEIKASTADTYHGIARATWSWFVIEGEIPTNPMKLNKVTDALPKDHGDRDNQFWTRDARDQLVKYVDQEAHDALDAASQDAIREFRDRAFVYLLADTGVRGAEVLATHDPMRNGVTFSDIDADTPAIYVFGKSGRYEWAGITQPSLRAVQRLQKLLDAPDNWPVFPTLHRPTLHGVLDDELADSEVDDVLQDGSVFDVMREHDIAPPAMTVDGGRAVMKRLSSAAEIDIEGNYLKPHGARRALGSELYDVQAEKAQDALRHENVETTHKKYRKKKAGEVSENLESVRYGDDED